METGMKIKQLTRALRSGGGTMCVAAAGGMAMLAWAAPAQAQAQQNTIDYFDPNQPIRPSVPFGFDRGRNISVAERYRPEFSPVGVLEGSFVLHPSVGLGLSQTSNAEVSSTGSADGILTVSPGFAANSDWSRHYLGLRASSDFSRYFGSTARNANAFNLNSVGRLDIGATTVVNVEASLAHISESPETGGQSSSVSVLSHYYRNFESLRAQYQSGQASVIVAGDRTQLSYDPIVRDDGTTTSQTDRDRTLLRGTVQLQYAFTPSFMIFDQVTYGRTDYASALSTGQVNRNSNSITTQIGVSVDFASFLRGQIGIGYMWRNYDSALYTSAAGVSFNGLIQFFPNDLTTFTLQGTRELQDGVGVISNAYVDNRASLRVDREIRSNLLGGLEVRYSAQHYDAPGLSTDGYAVVANARYFASRQLSINSKLGYVKRSSSQFVAGYGEERAEINFNWTL
jgi:hypothetical protein